MLYKVLQLNFRIYLALTMPAHDLKTSLTWHVGTWPNDLELGLCFIFVFLTVAASSISSNYSTFFNFGRCKAKIHKA